MLVEEADALTQEGLGPSRGAHRRGDAIGVRIGEGGHEVDVVDGGNHVGGLGEPRLDHGGAPHAQEALEHADAGAHHGVVRKLPGEADARQEAVLRGVVQVAIVAVQARERQAAHGRYRWNLQKGRGVLGLIIGGRGGREGLHIGRVEAQDAPVEALVQRLFELIAQSEVHGQMRRDLPVVLPEKAPGVGLLGETGRPNHAGRRGSYSEFHRRHRLANAIRRGRRVIQRPAGIGGVEIELAGLRATEVQGGLLVGAEFPTHADGVRPCDLGQRGADGVNHVRLV